MLWFLIRRIFWHANGLFLPEVEALHSEKESLICPLTVLILSELSVHDLVLSTLSFLKTTSLSMAMSTKGFNIPIEETDLQPLTKVNAQVKST